MTAVEILKQCFGYEQFRPGQAELVSHLLQGQDVFGIMPTGAGKSICYQVPALLRHGMTIVISPLISLMQDQVQALQANGISAVCLNSMLDLQTYKMCLSQVYQGNVKILYVAPERLSTPSFQRISEKILISMVIVDEAHCVSQWGHDFRPSYLQIPDFIRSLPTRPAVGAFTATATAEIAKDIIHLLDLQNPFCLTTGFNRENLYFSVQQPRDKLEALLQFLRTHRGQSGIVYCISRKQTESVTEELNQAGFPAVRYHAGLSEQERAENQNAFIYDKIPLIVATNAFGMGIDKSNVSFVVHYNMPKNMESYYQEAGRAGRDGSPADCVLFYDKSDIHINQFLIDHSNDNPNLSPEIQQQIRKKEMHRLEQMKGYCKSESCYRNYMLAYFGETSPTYCGNCGYCRKYCTSQDMTQETGKVISCIYYLHKQNIYLTAKELADVLRGKKPEKYQAFPLFGSLKAMSLKEMQEFLQFLISRGMLSEKEKAVLHLNRKSGLFLKEKQKLFMPVRRTAFSGNAGQTGTDFKIDEQLLALLRQCRDKLAQKEHIPAYVVFTDMTLRDMCCKLPDSDMAFLSISGVGRVKLEKYGDAFMTIIKNYLQKGRN